MTRFQSRLPASLYVAGPFAMGYTEFYNFLIPLYGLSLGMSAGQIGMFPLSHNREEVQAAPEDTAPVEIGMSDGTEEETHSRWRLHLGNRPSDSDLTTGNVPPTPR